MTADKLSPDEINGLLGQKRTEENAMSQGSLSKYEQEAVTELLNVSLGSSSDTLSSLLSQQVTMMTTELSIKEKDELLMNEQAPFFVVLGEYAGAVNGIQILSVNKEAVQTMAGMMDDGVDAEDAEKQFQLVQQTVQTMFDSVSRSMSAVLEREVSHSLSGLDVIAQREDFPVAKFTAEEWFVETAFQLKTENGQTILFHLCIPVQLAKQLAGILTDSTGEEEPEGTQEMPTQSNNQENTRKKSINPAAAPSIQPVQFSSFDETASSQSEPNNLNMLLDIPLQVTVELGRTKRMVKEILEVSHGSIIELDKLAGEPVDILINNRVIAVGEVVVIDENFGVRVTDVLSTADRLSKLR